MNSKRRRLVLGAALALCPLLALAIALGTVEIPLADTLRILGKELGFAVDGAARESDRLILLYVRFPRAVVLLLVGGALSIAGGILQSSYQNAMAEPGLLGVTGGAALGAVLVLRCGIGEQMPWTLPLAAFLGALAATFLVFLLAYLDSRPSPTTLLLTGVAVGSMAIAGVTLAMLFTDEYRLKQVLFWTVGGGEGQTWQHVWLAAPPILLGSALLCLQHHKVDALALGEEHALSVGLSVGRERLILLSLAALVAGAAVAVAGTIGFVGLIVPHVVRMAVGQKAKVLLPAAFLLGGGFLVLCDLLARVASAHREYPVGIVTSFLGVPFFLWLLNRSRRAAT